MKQHDPLFECRGEFPAIFYMESTPRSEGQSGFVRSNDHAPAMTCKVLYVSRQNCYGESFTPSPFWLFAPCFFVRPGNRAS